MRLAALVLLVALVPGSAAAQNAALLMARPVTVSFDALPVGSALERVAGAAGVPCHITPEARELLSQRPPVSFHVVQMRLEEALNALLIRRGEAHARVDASFGPDGVTVEPAYRLPLRRISLEVEQGETDASILILLRMLPLNYIFARPAAKPSFVTVHLKSLPFEEALARLLAEPPAAARFWYGDQDQGQLLYVLGNRVGWEDHTRDALSPDAVLVDLDVHHSDVRYVIKGIMKACGANYTLAQGVQGEVTLELHRVTVRQALDALSRAVDRPFRWMPPDRFGVYNFMPAQ